jgi:mannosyltransferase OCH1-like enzyme
VKIPRILHQVWVGPIAPPLTMMATWKAMNPSCEYRLWSDGSNPLLEKLGAEYFKHDLVNKKQYDDMREWNGKCDVLRYELLHEYGGVYIDADTLCVQELDERFFDLPDEKEVWSVWENEKCRLGIIASGFLGSVQGSKLMQACVEGIPKQNMRTNAFRSVGPEYFTMKASVVGHKTLEVLPSRHFIQEHYSGESSPCDESVPVFGRHEWGNTKALYGKGGKFA